MITTLQPGKRIPITARIGWLSGALDMKLPGRYAVRLHYAFRRKGSTQKLPQGDPVGDLGPLKAHPAFEIVSEPLVFDVVRPDEVFVEPIGVVRRGVKQRLATLLRVRFENWRKGATLTLDNTRVKIFVEFKSGKKSPRVKREVMDMPAAVIRKVVAPGSGVELIGPAGGWLDEEWTTEGEGPVTLRVIVTGHESGAPRVASHWVTLPTP